MSGQKVTQAFIDDAANTVEKALAKIVAQQSRIEALEKALSERTDAIMDIVQERIGHWLFRKQAAPLWNDIKTKVRTLHPSTEEQAQAGSMK